MNGLDPELLEVFREEAAQRLDRMEEMLLALEAGAAPADAVDSLFRDTHSIKGSAGMVGIREAQTLAHTIEDKLEGVRESGIFPKELADPLLRATDDLRVAVSGTNGTPAPQEAEAEPETATATPTPTATATVTESRSMRMSADKVDRLLDAVGETVLHSRRLGHLLDGVEADDERLEGELDQGEVLLDELQDSVIQMRTLPLSSITGTFPRAVRDLAAMYEKRVELEISGAETQLDRMILEGISESISHLLRNAVAHGIEATEDRERAGKPQVARIELRAEQRGSLVAIEVADDGRGVPEKLLRDAEQGAALADVLAQAGFSTADEVDDVSGRGVGLDAVKAHVESLRGGLEVHSEPGRGTVVTMLLPLTLALLHVLLIERGGQKFGVPLSNVEEVIAVESTLVLGGNEAIELRDSSVRLADVAQILGGVAPELGETRQAVIVSASGRRLAAVCDRIVEEQNVVVKSLGPLLADVPGYLGAAIMGDGGVALILDPAFVVEPRARVSSSALVSAAPEQGPAKVLVVDDQFTVRELQRSILEAAGYRVETARDGREALDRVVADADVDLVVTDIEMPEMTGIELLETIRENPERLSLPVVVVTSRGSDDDRRRGVEAGADAYIVKDEFDQRALLDAVGRLLAA